MTTVVLDRDLETRLQGMSDDQFRSLMFHMQAELARRFPEAAAIMDSIDTTDDPAVAALQHDATRALGLKVTQ